MILLFEVRGSNKVRSGVDICRPFIGEVTLLPAVFDSFAKEFPELYTIFGGPGFGVDDSGPGAGSCHTEVLVT